MAWEISILDLPMVANLEMSSSGVNESTSNGQYRCMRSTVAHGVQRQTASTGLVVGVLQNAPIAGEGAAVRCLGVSKVWVSSSAAAIVVGGMLVPTTNAGVMPYAGNTNAVVGTALEACSSGPMLIACLVTINAGGSTASLPK